MGFAEQLPPDHALQETPLQAARIQSAALPCAKLTHSVVPPSGTPPAYLSQALTANPKETEEPAATPAREIAMTRMAFPHAMTFNAAPWSVKTIQPAVQRHGTPFA